MEYVAIFEHGEMQCDQAKQVNVHQQRYDCIVDGELYNEKEVNACLKKQGYRPETIEETIVCSYLCWKEDMHKHLLGAYSLCIRKDKEIYICKDPLGLKPLYFMHKKNCLYVSNQIEKILEKSKENACLDQVGLLELFTFGPGVSETNTYYRGIEQLEMGTSLTISDGSMNKHTYYQPQAKEHTECLNDTIAHVKYLVEDAIARQMKDTHASFLSGGLDSSIITAVAAKKDPLWKTYALQYEGNDQSFAANEFQVSLDDEFIQTMTEKYGLDHTNLLLSQNVLCDLLEDATLAREMPGMADIDSSLLWLSRQVSTEHTNILSGECADEIFGGYPWFYKETFKNMNSFPWLHDSKAKQSLLHENIKQLGYDAYQQEKYEDTIKNISYLSTDAKEDRYARKQTILCLHWFMQTLITRQVSMGKNANVNIRAPFADVRILEYVYNIPWEMKYLDGQEKGILRAAFDFELPSAIKNRKKNPFPKTHNPKYTQLIQMKLKEACKDDSSILHILFDETALEELIDSKGASYRLPWYGQLMSGPQLLAYLYQIHIWQKRMNVEICL